MLIFFKIIIKKIISFIPLKYNFFFDSIAIPLFYKKKLRSLKYSMFDLYSFTKQILLLNLLINSSKINLSSVHKKILSYLYFFISL